MPRPTKDDPRDCFKTFRFTANEVTRLEARARARGQTVSSYIRTLIFDDDPALEGVPGSPGKEPRTAPHLAFQNARATLPMRMLTDQVRRIGVNLNQIAHRMNERRTPPPRDLTMLLEDIRQLVRQVREP